MANTAFLVISTAFGNVGDPPPGNAVMSADMVVKDPAGNVVYSQAQGASAQLVSGDTNATIVAKLVASARQIMNDPSMAVLIL